MKEAELRNLMYLDLNQLHIFSMQRLKENRMSVQKQGNPPCTHTIQGGDRLCQRRDRREDGHDCNPE
jgi:hypothetical protein